MSTTKAPTWRRFYAEGWPLYKATIDGIEYAIVKDAPEPLPWRVYSFQGGNGWPYDANFRTLAEAKAAAFENRAPEVRG